MKKLLIVLLLMVVVVLQSQTIYLQNMGNGDIGYFNTATRSFANVTSGSTARLEEIAITGIIDIYSLYGVYVVYILYGEPNYLIIPMNDDAAIWREVELE